MKNIGVKFAISVPRDSGAAADAGSVAGSAYTAKQRCDGARGDTRSGWVRTAGEDDQHLCTQNNAGQSRAPKIFQLLGEQAAASMDVTQIKNSLPGCADHCRQQSGTLWRQDAALRIWIYWKPISLNSLGLDSSTARRLWHAAQSLVMVLPSLEVWLPSWQRKQPGKLVWPMLLG